MNILRLAAAALLTIVSNQSHALDWSALRDFEPSASAWKYGYGKTGTKFTDYGMFVRNYPAKGLVCWRPNSETAIFPRVGINRRGEAFGERATVYPVDVLIIHPTSTEETIVRWTAPEAGTYRFKGFYEILSVYATGALPKIFVGGTDVTTRAFHGSNGALTGPGANFTTLTPGQRVDFSFTRTVPKGVHVYFGLNAAGNMNDDTIGLSITVTPIL